MKEKEGGGDDGANEDKKEALLSDEIRNRGSGEGRAGVVLFCGLYRVSWAMSWDLLLVGSRLLVDLLHGDGGRGEG